MGKSGELYINQMASSNDARTRDEDYELYMKAVHHDTFLLADTGDKVPFIMDFRDAAGVGEIESDPNCSCVIMGGQTYVIFTNPEIAKDLWKRVR